MQNGEKTTLFQRGTGVVCAKSRKGCLSKRDTLFLTRRAGQAEIPGRGKNRKKLYYYEINTIYGGEIGEFLHFITRYRCKKTVNAERDAFLVCAGDKWVFLADGQPGAGKRLLPAGDGQTPVQFRSMLQLFFRWDSIKIRLFYRRETIR